MLYNVLPRLVELITAGAVSDGSETTSVREKTVDKLIKD